MRIVCPVSQTVNEDRQTCKQCGTDLRPLICVAEAEAAAIEDNRRQRRRLLVWQRGFAGAVAAGLCLTICVAAWPRGHSPRQSWRERALARIQSDPLTRGLGIELREDGGKPSVRGRVPSEVLRDLVVQETTGPEGSSPDTSALLVVPAPGTGNTTPLSPAHYQIRPGDSWWLIARHKYGSAQLWRQVASANAPRSPKQPLRTGESIVLPAITIAPH